MGDRHHCHEVDFGDGLRGRVYCDAKALEDPKTVNALRELAKAAHREMQRRKEDQG